MQINITPLPIVPNFMDTVYGYFIMCIHHTFIDTYFLYITKYKLLIFFCFWLNHATVRLAISHWWRWVRWIWTSWLVSMNLCSLNWININGCASISCNIGTIVIKCVVPLKSKVIQITSCSWSNGEAVLLMS